MSEYFTKLRADVEQCRVSKERTRNDRRKICGAMFGAYFGDDFRDRPRPGEQAWPLLMMDATSYLAHLTYQNPRVMVRARGRPYSRSMRKAELMMNDWLAMNRFGELDMDFKLDAVVGPFAVMKVFRGATAGYGGIGARMRRVDLDDFIWDREARTWHCYDADYIGHDLCMRREQLEAEGFSDEQIARIPMSRWDVDTSGFVREMSSGTQSSDSRDVWYEMTELHLPGSGELLWFARRSEWSQPIREADARLGKEVPDDGMYVTLRFGRIPDNLMGTGALAPTIDLADHTNQSWKIHMLSTLATKEVGTVAVGSGGNEDDAKRIEIAKPGQWVPIKGEKGSLSVHKVGGGDPAAMATSLQARQGFSYAAFGMDQRTGSEAGADTATEASIQAGASSAMLRFMRELGLAANRQILSKLWFFIKQENLSYPVLSGDVTLHVTPETMRRIPADESTIDFDLHSLEAMTPERMLQVLDRSLARYAQTAQFSAPQGVVPNAAAIHKMALKLEGAQGTELEEMFTYTDAPPDADAIAPAPRKTGGQTYFRTARGGKQDGASEAAAMASMMSVGSDNGEAA